MAENQEDFYIGNTRIVPSRNLMVAANEKRIQLEPRIMDVLCMLADTPREVVSRDHIISTIWQVQFGGDESLTRAISIIRKSFKKAEDTDTVIETIPKRGYRLVRHISEQDPAVLAKPSVSPEPSPEPALPSPETLQSKPEPDPDPLQTPQVAQTLQQDISRAAPKQLRSEPQRTASKRAQTTPTANPGHKRAISPAVKFGVPAIILALALGTGWWLGQRSNGNPVAGTDLAEVSQRADVQNIKQAPNQAELATAILFSHLDDQISREDAIKSADMHLKNAVDNQPNEPTTMVARGWMHYINGENETAHIEFERAKTMEPQIVDAWIGMAYLAAREKNLDLALFNLDQAISVNRFSFRARGKKAELYMQQGDFKNAYTELDAILAFSPKNFLANKLLEKINLFEIYDRNNDQRLMPGEISGQDEALHRLLNKDGIPGLSIIEFKVLGDWIPEGQPDGPDSIDAIPIFTVNFDLRNPDNPLINID